MEARLIDLGEMAYEPCSALQRLLLEQVASGLSISTLLFVEHNPVLTLGANFHEENLLFSMDEYERRGIQVVRTDRGGDVTYHGPRQLVIYPIFNVADFGRDLHKWMRDLEETMILTLSAFGLEGYRFPPHTGCWTKGKKMAAIGVKIRRWTSMHGIALNCNNDLTPFGLIVPCGIEGHGVTSLTQEADREITVEEAKPEVKSAFERVFDLCFEESKAGEVLEGLHPIEGLNRK